MTRVVHLTSAHPRFDTRIFLKECRSLVDSGYSVALIVADGEGDEKQDGVNIYDVGSARGRLDRMFNITRRIYAKSIGLNADIFHFHDPELVPVGLKLKRLGKVVIFDAHEDLPKQLLSKPYLNKPLRWLLSKVFSLYESWACRKLNAIVTATPFINSKFEEINSLSVNVNNFPLRGELLNKSLDEIESERQWVCYVGGIATIRGIKEVVLAMEHLRQPVRLQLVGQFSELDTEVEVKGYKGWNQVDELGFVDRLGVRDVLSHSIAGLVTFHPLPNHIDAQPNKMFEYMSAGVPVIASDFPLWREIIEGNDCGLCVNPLNPVEIAEAINFLMDNPQRAREMGRNGRQAVDARYNWDAEEIKLLQLYSRFAK